MRGVVMKSASCRVGRVCEAHRSESWWASQTRPTLQDRDPKMTTAGRHRCPQCDGPRTTLFNPGTARGGFPVNGIQRMKLSAWVFLTAFVLLAPARAEDWPQFRGPTGDGHYRGPALPTAWGPDTNAVWKAPIPGRGWSSPVVWQGRVYLTTAVEKGG